MSEQQADDDTDDTEPTPGPWHADNTYISAASGRAIATAARYGDDHEGSPEDLANARLIAAAGTATSELPDEYDPVAALEELPRLLGALQTIARADGTRYAGTDALQHVAEKALDAIQIDTSETDE